MRGFLTLVCILSTSAAPALAVEEPAPAAVEFFEKSVRPVLVEHCFKCHGPDKQRGGFRMDSREFLLKGTDNGPGLVPEKPDESRLIQAIRYDGDVTMPPQGKLPQPAIDALTEWVRQGAVWPASPAPTPGGEKDADAWKKHWAFQPISDPAIPAAPAGAIIENDVDAFVAVKLAQAGLKQSPAADRWTWIRRATFDVTGLPPRYEDVVAFQSDTESDAYAKVVDRLLSSPQYGEKWARFWLDIARYADTKGYVFQEDRGYPHAFRYRDWVVKALNADMPYDQFLIKQLAADSTVTPEDQSDLAAMGFLTLGRRFLNSQQDIIDDRIDVVTRGTMGLTVHCARCHDHKFDPIPTMDYYSLYGVFASSNEPKDGDYPMRLVDAPNPHNVQVFIRGNQHNRGNEAPRRFLQAVSFQERKPFEKGSGRLEMAQAIASPENPLTARVIVNRLWGQYFGQSLVNTPSDFGVRTPPPSHPEMLDYLARELIRSGWSLKHVHRLILLSHTYRQASLNREEELKVDPENRLVWKQNRRRLPWEGLWDSLQFVSGQMDQSLGGAAVKLFDEPFPKRRALYGFIDRQNLPGTLRTFDFASPDTHAPQRFNTTVPQQALYLMNSPFLQQITASVLQRPDLGPDETAARIERLYQIVLARPPTATEKQLGLEFLKQAPSLPSALESPTWQYGYGEFDSEAQRIKTFNMLPHWTGLNWQGGKDLPDAELDWALLAAHGGHPGRGTNRAVIRRWIAPRAGTVQIRGKLQHNQKEGDGVFSRIVSSRTGVLGEWTAQKSEAQTEVNTTVEAGETIDFYTDCRTEASFDSFIWGVRVKLDSGDAGARSEWSSRQDFEGPQLASQSPWEQYVQVLLLANEFVFID